MAAHLRHDRDRARVLSFVWALSPRQSTFRGDDRRARALAARRGARRARRPTRCARSTRAATGSRSASSRARGARRGRARAARRRTRRARLVAAPDLDRVARAGGRARAARRGAEPAPADLPRARDRVHHAPGAAGAARRPARVSRHRPRRARAARARGGRARRRSALQLLVCDRALPEADPAALSPYSPPPGGAVGGSLHLGHHGRPEGRAAQRRDDRGGRARRPSASSSAPTIATRWYSRSRTSAGSGCYSSS